MSDHKFLLHRTKHTTYIYTLKNITFRQNTDYVDVRGGGVISWFWCQLKWSRLKMYIVWICNKCFKDVGKCLFLFFYLFEYLYYFILNFILTSLLWFVLYWITKFLFLISKYLNNCFYKYWQSRKAISRSMSAYLFTGKTIATGLVFHSLTIGWPPHPANSILS